MGDCSFTAGNPLVLIDVRTSCTSHVSIDKFSMSLAARHIVVLGYQAS